MTDQTNVAVVTGGAQGIGLACAQKLSRQGSKIALWDMDRAALDAARAEEHVYALGGQLLA